MGASHGRQRRTAITENAVFSNKPGMQRHGFVDAAIRGGLPTRLTHSGMRLEHARRHPFDRGSLVEAGRAPFAVIHSRGPVRLSY